MADPDFDDLKAEVKQLFASMQTFRVELAAALHQPVHDADQVAAHGAAARARGQGETTSKLSRGMLGGGRTAHARADDVASAAA